MNNPSPTISVTSAPIRTAPSSIAGHHLATLLRRRPLLWFLPPLSLLAVAAITADWRWLVVALAFILIILPMAFAVAWILSLPSAASALRPYTVTIPSDATDHVVITPLSFPYETDADSTPLVAPPAPWLLSPSLVSQASLKGNHTLVLHLHSSQPANLLLIPLKSLPDSDSRLRLIALFLSHASEII